MPSGDDKEEKQEPWNILLPKHCPEAIHRKIILNFIFNNVSVCGTPLVGHEMFWMTHNITFLRSQHMMTRAKPGHGIVPCPISGIRQGSGKPCPRVWGCPMPHPNTQLNLQMGQGIAPRSRKQSPLHSSRGSGRWGCDLDPRSATCSILTITSDCWVWVWGTLRSGTQVTCSI